MEFKDYITHKFIEYEKQQGARVTVTEFASLLGTSQSTLSCWMNGSRVPGSQKSIELLVSIFGSEVYQVLGKTNNAVYYDPISEAPPEIKSRFSAAIAEANHKYRVASESGLSLSESEAASILTEAMAKYGFSTTPPSPSLPPEE